MILKARMAFVIVLLVFPVLVKAQEDSFLITLVPPDPASSTTKLQYDAAYGRETFEPLGGDNVEQVLGIRSRLSKSTFLAGRVGLASKDASTLFSQHVEFLVEAMDAEKSVMNVWIGPGFRHEYGGTNVLLGRIIAGRRFAGSELYGSLLLEKPLSPDRDGIDLVLTAGWSCFVSPTFRLGIEGMGQDLEGFWNKEEAEGGATLFVGPTMVATIPATSWTATLGAGPIIRATQSGRLSSAMRDLPLSRGNGFVVHAALGLGL